ncbi:DUF134 domain-containing protein [Candidatus Woesearchaeota archaeon]|nr:DUF134 domain-containing protein [Candidatus Woesearchaeota archaeon]
MVRPKKYRFIGKKPQVDFFKPRGIPLSQLEEITLNVEEYESIRLKDVENLDQNKAAELMNVSQPTFSRILENARKKTADAIVHGKAIRIQGGVFRMVKRIFQCISCGNEWELLFGTGRPRNCPECKSTNIHRTNAMTGFRGGRRHHRNGRHGRRWD